ncbi:MAG: hypothetical protein KatS3mg008_1383 [Acidimicrobiales bacterium]|nr:MAG: hypothetical protein KatS3mg008_1383 [Acidimicrobiales bacterium]
MTEQILRLLGLLLMLLVYVFFLRIARVVWLEVKAPLPATPAQKRFRRRRRRDGIPHPEVPTKLVVVEPKEHRGRQFDLPDEVLVGRAPSCQVRLDDNYVSSTHARIWRQDGLVMIEDLGSTNGTWVNKRRVDGRVALERGDRLQLGKTILELA